MLFVLVTRTRLFVACDCRLSLLFFRGFLGGGFAADGGRRGEGGPGSSDADEGPLHSGGAESSPWPQGAVRGILGWISHERFRYRIFDIYIEIVTPFDTCRLIEVRYISKYRSFDIYIYIKHRSFDMSFRTCFTLDHPPAAALSCFFLYADVRFIEYRNRGRYEVGARNHSARKDKDR